MARKFTAPQLEILAAAAAAGGTMVTGRRRAVIARLEADGFVEWSGTWVATEAGRYALVMEAGTDEERQAAIRGVMVRTAVKIGLDLDDAGLEAKVAEHRDAAEELGGRNGRREYNTAVADELEAALTERRAATAVDLEAHPDDDAADMAAPTAGGRRYVAGAVHLFPADDPGVALCGKSSRGGIDTLAALTCPACTIGNRRRIEADVDEAIEARRQAEANPAPTLPGIDAAVVEAELGGRQELELVVIPCGGAKLEQAAPAGDLYRGSLHRSARMAADAIAERTGAHRVILSALHGLTELDKVLEPYDVTVGDPEAIGVDELVDELRQLGARRVIALTPGRYTELLRSACRVAGVELVAPLSGTRGVLEQRGRLRRIRTGELALDRAA